MTIELTGGCRTNIKRPTNCVQSTNCAIKHYIETQTV